MEIVIHNDLEGTNWSVIAIIVHLEKKQNDGLVLSTEGIKAMYIRLKHQISRLGNFYLIIECKFA